MGLFSNGVPFKTGKRNYLPTIQLFICLTYFIGQQTWMEVKDISQQVKTHDNLLHKNSPRIVRDELIVKKRGHDCKSCVHSENWVDKESKGAIKYYRMLRVQYRIHTLWIYMESIEMTSGEELQKLPQC